MNADFVEGLVALRLQTDMEEFVRKLEEEQQQQQQLRPTGLSEEAEMKQQEA